MKGHSEKVELILKSREAALSAVQIYNNPLILFKTESFIVLFSIAWTYLLHAYYRSKNIDYRCYTIPNKRKKFIRNKDGSIRYLSLLECVSHSESPLDKHTSNNLKFLIGLRNQIVHQKTAGLDSHFSARYQACALNFNRYVKALHGDKYSLDEHLSLSLQFSELNDSQADVIKDKDNFIPSSVRSYVAGFDGGLSDSEIGNHKFSYRLLFSKVVANRRGQADRVIEFGDPKSNSAKNVQKEYVVIRDREKPKLRPKGVIKQVQDRGFENFKMHKHTLFWKEHDGKNADRGFGVMVSEQWYWYENWVDFILKKLRDNAK